MRLGVSVDGSVVRLVPYRRAHVVKYHGWMEDERLREQTASERLSLAEELDMQQRWVDDKDKCTFIVLARCLLDTADAAEVDAMVGDVNLFLDGEDASAAEMELMIAERQWRRKGLGCEAAALMMRFGVERLGLRRLTAKIGRSNAPSLRLFERLGFVVTAVNQVFDEVNVCWTADAKLLESLATICPHYHISECEG